MVATHDGRREIVAACDRRSENAAICDRGHADCFDEDTNTEDDEENPRYTLTRRFRCYFNLRPATLGPAINGHKHSKLQTHRDLRSNLIFTLYLAESMKFFDLTLF